MTLNLRSSVHPFDFQELFHSINLQSPIPSTISNDFIQQTKPIEPENPSNPTLILTLTLPFLPSLSHFHCLPFSRICPSFSCADTKSPDTCAAINDNSPAITVDATSCDSSTELTGVLSYASLSPRIHSFINSMQACCGASPVPPPMVPTSIEGIVTDMYSVFSCPSSPSSSM